MRHALTIWQMLGRTFAVLFLLLAVAAIVFPIFAKARSHDTHHSYLSNMKMLGLGLLQYAYNYDDLMPPPAYNTQYTWRNAVYPQIRSMNIYRCPEDKRPFGPDGFFQSYAFSIGSVTDTADAKPQPLATVSSPESLILLCEVQNTNCAVLNVDAALRFPTSQHVLAVRHSGGGNYLFANGHAKWFRPLATQGYWYRDSTRPLSVNGLAVLREAQAR